MGDFDDLLSNNAEYASQFTASGLEGAAKQGLAIVTCMDSRITPLDMVGLGLGDAKVLRTPGGRLTPDALTGLVLACSLLNVHRIMMVAHTRCAMASRDDAGMAEAIKQSTGIDVAGMRIGTTSDQQAGLRYDVDLLRTHPHIPDTVKIGGFIYDIDSGKLTQHV